MTWSVAQINGASSTLPAAGEAQTGLPVVQLAQATLPARRNPAIEVGQPPSLQLVPPATSPTHVIDMSHAIDVGTRATLTLETRGMNGQDIPIFASAVSVEPGLATTAAHFLENSGPIYYEGTTADGERVIGKVTVVGRARELDIGLIRLEHVNLVTARLATRPPRRGDPVAVIGAAEGYADSATVGIISGLHRYPGGPFCDCFQTDAAINGGNSGGGVYNADGELQGQAMSLLQGKQNIGFAVPADTLARLIPRLKRGDLVSAPTGFSIAWPDIATAYQAGRRTPDGAAISTVETNSLAARAGLKVGDVIQRVNDRPASSLAGALTELTLIEPGQRYTMQVRRGTETLTFNLSK